MQGSKVLIVDDSTSVRKVLERLLSTKGLLVNSSENAEQGLESVGRDTPNLVIADVVMPGMSGFELCQLLKLNKRTQDIPVILISGIVNDGVVAQAQQAGAFDVVSKPFTPDDLFPKIERALNAARALQTEALPQPEPIAPVEAPTPIWEPVVAEPVAPVFAAEPAFALEPAFVPEPAFTPEPAPNIWQTVETQPEPQTLQAEPESVFQTIEMEPESVPAPMVVAPAIAAPVTAPVQEAIPVALAQNSAVQAELRPFLDKPEIESAMVISSKGNPVAWVGQPIEDPDTFAAYVRTLISISSIFGDKHQLSPLQGLSLEYLGKTLIISRVSQGHSLALLMRGTGGTGVIRYLIVKQMPQLKAALGEV